MSPRFLLVLTLIIPVLATHQAFAAPIEKYPLILVEYSKACQIALSNNLLTDCPPLSKIAKYDTSNQNISGHFKIVNSKVIRDKPNVKNHWMYYNTTEIVCVVCSANLSSPDLYKEIIIERPGFTYIDKNATVDGKRTWNSYDNRYMQGCNTATIGYSDSLLNDTISYMKSNCTVTNINNTKTHIISDQPWEYNNPYSSLVMVTNYKNILSGHYLTSNMTQGGLGPSDCIHHTCSITTSGKKW